MHLKLWRIFPGLLLFFLLLAGCEEATDWELQSGNNGQLVVDAVLTDERREQEIRLSRSYDELNGRPPAVTNATVSVWVGNQTIRFYADPNEPGRYVSEREFAVFRDLNYRLNIEWEGQTYSGVSTLSTVAPIPPITFVAHEDSDSVSLAAFASPYNPNHQAFYEVNINWSHLNGDSSSRAKVYLYTFNELEVSGLIRPEQEIVYFPTGSTVQVRKYGLNDDFAEYLRILNVETQWRGGAFYGDGSSLPTNITNGGLGFFSTCAVRERTVIAR